MKLGSVTMLASIGSKLTAALLACSLGAAAIVGLAAYWQQQAAGADAIRSELNQRYQAVLKAMDDQGAKGLALAHLFARDPSVADALDRQDRQALLSRYGGALAPLRDDLKITFLNLHLPDGRAYVRIHAPETWGDSILARRAMIRDTIRDHRTVAGIEPARETLGIFAVVPIFKDNRFVGIADMGSALGVPFLARMKAELGVDIAMHLVKGDTPATLAATFAEKTLLTPAAHAAAAAGAGLAEWQETRLEGRPSAVLAGPLRNYAGEAIGTVEVALDISDFKAEQRRALLLLLGVFALVIAGTAAVAWRLTAHLGRPVAALNRTMRGLAEGRLAGTVPSTERRDEIGAMARSVAVFQDGLVEAERLRAEQAADRTARERRALVVDDLVRGFERSVGDVVARVSSAAVEMQATAGQLTATAGATAEQSHHVAQAARDAAGNVSLVTASASALGISVGTVGRQIALSAESAQAAVDEATSAAGIVADLSNGASRIGDVIALISGIAAQTNLLALNATIEAARAGDAGRGFAVVAAEVKDLAGQTARATAEIGEQIAAVQAATGRAVAAITGIARTIGSVHETALDITRAAGEQDEAACRIVDSVAQASRRTDDVSATIAGVSRSAEETGGAATQVLAAASELAEQAERLRGQVGDFLGAVRAA
ncbi:methyl-accepting chemotaxis protein [Methylobacterium sp. BE186]|uniref:methyl-accepting chemotaxis protein n=1 Tax=Methylobacterium sp. BE186 TaxID=2817715 RepID=UPI0028629EEA|nr:cache domain-containing protein [Methylobacterium sp. BE186]MDR7038053.1 methyl-accepting chemotaxis protein [Methylobacterium sp. BE186]